MYETWPAEAAPPPPTGDDPVVFNAEVRPNRSLPNTGFYVLMGAIALVSFTAGIAFMMAGAWPVLGFFGLDVLLVWLAFRISYRDGKRLETIEITRREIRVGRRYPTGHQTWFRLPSAWTRVALAGAGESDVQAQLTAMGKTLIIGAMLSPRERESLAAAVREALDTVRRPDAGPPAQESGGGTSA